MPATQHKKQSVTPVRPFSYAGERAPAPTPEASRLCRAWNPCVIVRPLRGRAMSRGPFFYNNVIPSGFGLMDALKTPEIMINIANLIKIPDESRGLFFSIDIPSGLQTQIFAVNCIRSALLLTHISFLLTLLNSYFLLSLSEL